MNRNPETGMVYRGDCDLVHIADGQRRAMGESMADHLDKAMRFNAVKDGLRDAHDAYRQKLCPGCYMVAGFNAMVALAKRNGQSLRELGRSLAGAFQRLADEGEDAIEEIAVVLDSEAPKTMTSAEHYLADMVLEDAAHPGYIAALARYGIDVGGLR